MSKLGLISDEQFNEELRHISPVPEKTNKTPPGTLEGVVENETPSNSNRGRGQGNVEVPDGLRKLIGEESIIHGRQAAINFAADFGISPSSVSAYAKGSTSTATYNRPESGLSKYLANRKKRISKKALLVLQSSLDQITPEKLSDLKPRDVSSIAKDMSVIAKNMAPDSANAEQNAKPQFIVYAPTMRDERSYETIVVKDDF